MTLYILNIASGYLPLCPHDFPFLNDCVIYNYDPLDLEKLNPNDSWYDFNLSVLYKKHVDAGDFPDTHIYFDHAQLMSDTEQIQFDLILSISPYGFSVIDKHIDSRLKIGSYIVLFGNRSNPWLMPTGVKGRAVTTDVLAKYQWTRLPSPGSEDEQRLQLQKISTKIFSLYKSHKSDPLQRDPTTEIQCSITYQKTS